MYLINFFDYYCKSVYIDFFYKIFPFEIKKRIKKNFYRYIFKYISLQSYIKFSENLKIKKDINGFRYTVLFFVLTKRRPKNFILNIKNKRVLFLDFKTYRLSHMLYYVYIFYFFFKIDSITKNSTLKYNFSFNEFYYLDMSRQLEIVTLFRDLELTDQRSRKRILLSFHLNFIPIKKLKIEISKLNTIFLSFFNIFKPNFQVDLYKVPFKIYKDLRYIINKKKNEEKF